MRLRAIISAIDDKAWNQLTTILDSKSYGSENEEDQEQENIKALKLAVTMENWTAVLLLLTRITIDDRTLATLSTHKDQIISQENLQYLFIDKEYLRSSLTKSNNLGRLAYLKRGLRTPRESSGALVKIQQELKARDGLSEHYNIVLNAVNNGDIEGIREQIKLSYFNKTIPIIKQAMIDGIEVAVKSKQWAMALFLITSMPTLSKTQMNLLLPYKDKILTPENLKLEFINDEYLKESLGGHTSLGQLAGMKTGLLDPKPQRAFLGVFSYRSGSLGAISKEYMSRVTGVDGEQKEVKPSKEQAVLNQLAEIIKINASFYGVDIQQDAKQFENELYNWYRGVKLEKNPIYSLLETLTILMDRGYEKNVKTSFTRDATRQFTEVHFQSTEAKHLGKYVGDNKLHIGKAASVNEYTHFPLLSTVVHELVHHLCQLIYGSANPQPLKEWETLVDKIDTDLKNAKRAGHKHLGYFGGLNFSKSYSKSKHAAELVPRLAQLLLESPTALENESDFLSEKTIETIKKLFFDKFLGKDLVHFKQGLVEKTQLQSKKLIGKSEIFRCLQKKKLDKVTKHVASDHEVSPFHWAVAQGDMRLVKELESRGFSPTDVDAQGRPPIAVSVITKKFSPEIFFYLKEAEDKEASKASETITIGQNSK